MRYDLHIHTKYSTDCSLDIETIIKIATEKKLNGVAITDHNTIQGGLDATEFAREDFQVIVGSEIQTNRGEIIGLFLEKEIQTRNFYEVIKEIREQEGIVVIPHPFDKLRKYRFTPTSEDIKYFDCIEVFNSRCILQKYNTEAMNFAIKHKLRIIAGSDAHLRNEIGNAGIVVSDNSEDLRKRILNGNVEIFGKRSSIIDRVRFKALKTLRK